MFGVNMASFLARIIWGFKPPTAITGLPITPIPILDKIPIIGEALFSHDIFLYFTFFVLVPLCWLVIHRTRWGLVITATGENPKAADTMGVNVYRVRSLCIILGGIMASLGGAYLTLAYVKMFSDGMTAGRGWIAIALTFFSQWDPAKALIGALLFGASYSFYFRAQTLAIPIPYRFLLMVPYVMTIVAMVIIYTRKRVVAPAALATPYRRGST
jgi:simple sugar transport system permease protein